MLTISGCRTTKEIEKIELPPKPCRQEIKAPTNITECAEVINYYEHLVQQWEEWGNSVDAILTDIEK